PAPSRALAHLGGDPDVRRQESGRAEALTARRSARYAASAGCHARGSGIPSARSVSCASTEQSGRLARRPYSAEGTAVSEGVTSSRGKTSRAKSCHDVSPPLVAWQSPRWPEPTTRQTTRARSSVYEGPRT